MSNRRKINAEIIEIYQLYFDLNIICDVEWAPSTICTGCMGNLSQWRKGKIDSMPFGIPVIWTNPQVHNPDECYVCVNFKPGTNRNKTRSMKYKATKFVQLPLSHSENVPVPKRPSPTAESISTIFETVEGGSNFEYVPTNVTPDCDHTEITQDRLDIIARRLKLSQRQTILLAKELKTLNLLAPDARVYGSIGRHRNFTPFFKTIENNSLAYCDDIRGLVSTLHNEYAPEDWRLFIDSSKSSLKAVLLHITNSKKSVPLALSTDTKENYLSLKKILDLLKYNDNKWKICADLKVVSILSGLQLGYTKNMCFMCLWDTRYCGDQYEKRDWITREEVRLRRHNVVEVPLVQPERILLPPLHIKLGIVKNFIKKLDREGNAFNELRRIFPRLSGMKIKEGV